MSFRYSVRLDIWYEDIQDRHGKIDESTPSRKKPTKKQAIGVFKNRLSKPLPEGQKWVIDIITYEWDDENNEISQLYNMERLS